MFDSTWGIFVFVILLLVVMGVLGNMASAARSTRRYLFLGGLAYMFFSRNKEKKETARSFDGDQNLLRKALFAKMEEDGMLDYWVNKEEFAKTFNTVVENL